MAYDFNEYHDKCKANIAACEKIAGGPLTEEQKTAVVLMVGRIYRYTCARRRKANEYQGAGHDA
jgi:hypothetical protein